MSSEAVIKCVAKKLKYYFDVKRLEDGFDLSGVNSPQLDHPPLKSRPTLQYDGLHDRALKHYFSLPEVKVKLTQMGPGQKENREFVVKKKLKTTMKRHNYLLTRDQDLAPPLYLYDVPKSSHKSRGKSPSPLPEFAYTDTRQGRKLRKDMTGFGVPLRSFRHKSLKGGWPLLRSVPNHNISKVEAERLVNVATKLLVATQTVENLQPLPPERTRPQSAPKPFEKPRGGSAKYTWDIHGRRHKAGKHMVYEENQDNAYTTHSGSASSQEYRRRKKERDAQNTRRPESPPPPEVREPKTQMEQIEIPSEPQRTRPRSAKRRQRQKTVIQVSKTEVGEDVAVHSGTQTHDSGNQADRHLQKNPQDIVVEDGDWAEYQIYVRTGNRIGASTKADVKLTLYGEKGKTKEFPLDKSKRHKVCFQKGKEDLFIIPCHHVGKLVRVKIGHDRTELSNAWFLEGVTVYDMRDKRIYEFMCERWLSGADGDRKTYRDLEVDRERAFIQGVHDIENLTNEELINFICYPAHE